MKEEEQEKGGKAHHNDHQGKTDKNGGRSESRRRNGREIIQPALAEQILAILQKAARFPKAKIAGAFRGLGVTQPLRLHEDHRVYDRVAHCEHRPEDADGSRVAQVVGLVMKVLKFR